MTRYIIIILVYVSASVYALEYRILFIRDISRDIHHQTVFQVRSLELQFHHVADPTFFPYIQCPSLQPAAAPAASLLLTLILILSQPDALHMMLIQSPGGGRPPPLLTASQKSRGLWMTSQDWPCWRRQTWFLCWRSTMLIFFCFLFSRSPTLFLLYSDVLTN